ncbi:hypothetical protein ANN_09823 [Periplaneta americana]|uniref:Uncharacterized protein n=1 Tax=Periplaneta americana TaxID=6978 RepID=A0ABQ8TPZ7_PERAM|nr:hypothetical protein ANN_09823 [Periplaneta americana]
MRSEDSPKYYPAFAFSVGKPRKNPTSRHDSHRSFQQFCSLFRCNVTSLMPPDRPIFCVRIRENESAMPFLNISFPALLSSSRLATSTPYHTACDNALWGFIKRIVARERYDTIDEFKDAVRRVFQQITPAMMRRMSHRTWRHIILCEENDGLHTVSLDTQLVLLGAQFKVCHGSLYAVMWLADEPREFNLPTLPQRCITYEVEKLPSKYGVHSEEYLPIRTIRYHEYSKTHPKHTQITKSRIVIREVCGSGIHRFVGLSCDSIVKRSFNRSNNTGQHMTKDKAAVLGRKISDPVAEKEKTCEKRKPEET